MTAARTPNRRQGHGRTRRFGDVDDLIRGVETFAAGEYEGDEDGETWKYSDSDIQTIARNFQTLSAGDNPLHKVPVVRTHDNVNAHATVANAKARGDLLTTDWRDVDPKLRQDIDAKRVFKVSAEIKRDFRDKDGKLIAKGPYLYRIAVLGADVPRVKGLADVEAYADRVFRFADNGNAIGSVKVNNPKIKNILVGLGVPEDAITDDVIAALAEAMGGSNDMDDDPAGDDDERGSGGAFDDEDDADNGRYGMPPPTKKAMDGDEEDYWDEDEDDSPDNWPPGTDKRAGNPRQPRKRTVTEMYADRVKRAIRHGVGAEVRKAVAKLKKLTDREGRAREGRAREERQTEVRMFCDRMAASGRMSPADNDEGSPHSERSRLLRLAAQRQVTHTFADPRDAKKQVKATELQLQQQAIEQREPRRFSERVRQSAGTTVTGTGGGDGHGDAFRAKAEAHYKRELERHAARTAAVPR